MAPIAPDQRVLVVAATSRDGELSERILGRHRFAVQQCSSFGELRRQAREGVAVVLFAEELLTSDNRGELLGLLGEQPAWSDLPVIVLSPVERPVAELLDDFDGLCNLTILERPVQIATLVSAVRTSIQSRQRQYEVRDLVRRLQEADRNKDDFLAMLGHELRNPLGVLRMALTLLEHPGAGAETSAQQVPRIRHQVEHLTRMVEDLLDLSRISRGKVNLRLEPVELNGLARRAVEDCRPSADAREHEVRVVSCDEDLWVEADAVRLEQVVCNLVNNAIKYTPEGGTIEIEVRREGAAAVIEVADDGIGIPPSQIETIFESFTQADRSLDRASGGLGLGLALVRHLVGLHHGEVKASSDGEGRGATFTVWLPTVAPRQRGDGAEPGRDADEAAGGEARENAPPMRILVVEDLPDAREALAELLRLEGFEVETVGDGRAGVEAILDRRPDVALVDIGLPGLDGYQVARAVRTAMPDSLYLLAMTGYGQEQDRQRSAEAGFDGHLVKPVEPRDLLALLRRRERAPSRS